MIRRLVSPPATRGVTLAQAKAHLRVEGTDQDDLIDGYIDAAIDYLDGPGGVLGRALEPQEWEIVLQEFPLWGIPLQPGPVTAIVSVTYQDAGGTDVVHPTESHQIEHWIGTDVLSPVTGAVWPVAGRFPAGIRVRFATGTGTPASVRQAILMMVAHWHEHREAAGASMAEIPFGARNLIQINRRVAV